ncbi:MAG: DEAD/DEAH box helicase [Halanaerobiales bacterium]|nr:DEAD/DEAH box helicase [Halanaerobiales bacterium]
MLEFVTEKMEHQKKAYNKLSKIKVGACLMEMGTGKTRVALELAIDRIKANKVDCILWLCPVSVKKTIENEINKHIDKCSYELVQPDKIRNWQAHIYICGIESVSQSDRINFKLYNLINRRNCFLIVDESSLIKNYEAKRTKRILKYGEQCEYKLILNGTPITNTEQDLYSQWKLLDWRILGYRSFWSFAANHLEYSEKYPGMIVRAHNTDYLSRKIAPYSYQVTKKECMDLPEKNYSSRWVDMTWEQRDIYHYTMDEILMNITVEEFESYTLFQLFTALQKVISGITMNNKFIFNEPQNNPRIKTLLEIISELPDDKKVIIWCKYQHEIKNIIKVLSNKYGDKLVSEYWGELTEQKRNIELDKFKNNTKFLIANKSVGAFGLNLQYCNYCIYYSNDFNWATRKQSEDRIHRAGQKNNVHIIDIITRNSIDERIQESLSKKENLVNCFKNKLDEFKEKDDIRRWLGSAEKISKKECV